MRTKALFREHLGLCVCVFFDPTFSNASAKPETGHCFLFMDDSDAQVAGRLFGFLDGPDIDMAADPTFSDPALVDLARDILDTGDRYRTAVPHARVQACRSDNT